VQAIAPSSGSIEVDFVYYPDTTVSESWFRLLLREAGLDIWIEMLRDELFVDTTDDLNSIAFAAPLQAWALSAPQSDPPRNISNSCEASPSSAEVDCEIISDLLLSGLTDPYLTAGTESQNGWSASFDRGYAFLDRGYGSVSRMGNSFSIRGLQAYIESLINLTSVGRCCAAGTVGFDGGSGDLAAQAASITNPTIGAIPSAITNPVTNPTIGAPPAAITNAVQGVAAAAIADAPNGGTKLSAFFSNPPALSGPAAVPEPSISALLLIGIGGLVFVLGKRTFSRRSRVA
jgi:hypothetical protein